MVEDRAARSARAVAAVWDHSRHAPSPAEALRAASAQVCDPLLRPRQRNPLCAAVITELSGDTPEMVGAARAGDGELFVRHNAEGPLVQLTTEDMLWPADRARWETERHGPGQGSWAAQEAMLDDPEAWRTPVVGLVPDLAVEVHDRCDAVEVITATDGPRLVVENANDVAGWLGSTIVDVGPAWPHRYPFGDLALIWARWQP